MVDPRSIIVRYRGFLFRVEVAKIYFLVVFVNYRSPLAALVRNEVDAFISRSVICLKAFIAGILATCTFAKVQLAIVQAVQIFVVTVLPHKCSVHSQHLLSFLSIRRWFHPDCIKTASSTLSFDSTPRPLRQPIEIFGIDNRILALRERYQPERLIKRLSNRVSLYRHFGHWSSLKGLLLLDRILTQEASRRTV